MIHLLSKTTTGNSTGSIGSKIRGKLIAIKAVADANVTNNWDLVLAGSVTGVAILTDAAVTNNGTKWWYPRALANKVADGAAATDAFVQIPLFDEAITFTITNAGTTGVITLTAIFETDEK